MPQIQRSALVMYSDEQMFKLVNDVKNYPAFVPDCAESKIIEDKNDSMVASLLIKKGTINKWFTTRNTFASHNLVSMELVDGPFKRLVGDWRFHPLDSNACKVELELEFEFSNVVMDAAFGKVFSHVAGNMVKAFSERAKVVYG